MDSVHFDRLARTFGQFRSRRQALRGPAGAALGGLLARFRADGAGAQGACLENGQRCGGERGTWCSGLCKRKSGSRRKLCQPAVGQGTCTVEQDGCVDGSTCNGDPINCRCSITTRGHSFCRSGSVCMACKQDAECEGAMGPGSKCVRCPGCFGFDTLCARPCPT